MNRPTPSPEFDPRIADWLEDDPDQAPGAVLETVLAAFASIPQRRASRVPWRFPLMNRLALFGAAALTAVVAVGGLLFLVRPSSSGPATHTASPPPSVGPSGPAASPGGASTSPAASPQLDGLFTSTRYGYSVAYPQSWTTAPSSASWTAGTTNLWGSGRNDELKGADVRFSGAAQVLAEGASAEHWLGEYSAGSTPSSWPKVPIGSVIGRIDYDGGPAAGGGMIPGGRMFDAVVVVGSVAFNFNMDGNVDRETFERFLAGVTLPDSPFLARGFISERFGFRLMAPEAWAVTRATKTWASGYTYEPAATDTFGSPQAFVANSTKIPAGMTFETWYAAFDAERRSGTCGAPASEETITVDGATGRLDVHCPTFYFEAVVPKGGRAYVYTVYAPVTRPVLEAILATVHLTPATAK